MNVIRTFLLGTAGVAALSLALPVAAYAQTTPAPEAEAPAETIVVTGSRIRRSAATAAAPLIQISQDDVLQSGEANVIDYLADIPALAQSTVPEDTTGSVLGTGGLALLNLRDLGSGRTLVLVDGRRHVGATLGGLAVDVDSIPRLLVRSVEITTGGQSAVYGADAVSGVVNYVMKTDFEGIDFDIAASQLNQNGELGRRASLLIGQNFLDDKLNVYFSAEYDEQDEVLDSNLDWRNTNTALVQNDLDPAAPNNNDGIFDVVLMSNLRNISRPRGGVVILADQVRASETNNPLQAGGAANTCATPSAATSTFNNNFASNFAACFPFGVELNNTFVFNPDRSFRAGNYGTYQPPAGNSRALNVGGDGLAVGTEFSQASRVPESSATRLQGGFTFEFLPGITAYGELKHVEEDTAFASQPSFYNWGIGTPVAGALPFIAAGAGGSVAEAMLGTDNAYLPAGLRTLIQSNVRPVFGAPTATGAAPQTGTVADTRAMFQFFGPDRFQQNSREVTRWVLGLKGEMDQLAFAQNLSWEIGYTEGKLNNQNIEGGVDVIRFWHAADAVTDTAGLLGTPGAAVCRVKLLVAQGVTVNNPNTLEGGVYTASNPTVRDCVPFNVFGADLRFGADGSRPGANAASEAYYGAQIRVRHENVQRDWLGFASAELWDFWGAGPIGIAVGGEYREETTVGVGRSRDTGTRRLFLNTGADFAAAEYSVAEYFGELRLPLFKDVPFLGQYAEISGAWRQSAYDFKQGSVEREFDADTRSAQFQYRPFDDLLFRATQALAVRVPTLSEVFSPLSQTFANGFTDPCDRNAINAQAAAIQVNRRANCATLLGSNFSGDGNTGTIITYPSGIPGFNGANPNLQPEESESTTFSLVYQPSFVPNFTLVLDYYDIEITNVIASLTLATAASACVSDTAINTGACSTFTRNGFIGAGDPNNFRINNFFQAGVNYAKLTAEGVDYTLSYRFDLADVLGADYGEMSVRVRGSYLLARDNFTNIAIPTQSQSQVNQFANPRNRFLTTIGWTPNDKLSLSWDIDYQSIQDIQGPLGLSLLETDGDNRSVTIFKAPEFVQHDLSFRYAWSDTLSLRGGVVNVLDEEPAEQVRVAGNIDGSSADTYDFFGRRFYVAARFTY